MRGPDNSQRGSLRSIMRFLLLLSSLCTSSALMAIVEVWPSDKLHVSKPTWWLEVHAFQLASNDLICRPLRRMCTPDSSEPLSFQLCWLEWRPGKLWSVCSIISLVSPLGVTHFAQVLRVVNDDLVKSKAGFGTHPHRDMVRFSAFQSFSLINRHHV